MKLKCLFVLLITSLLISCATDPKNRKPFDRGVYNPNDIPEEELSTLYIAECMTVNKINDEKVEWVRKADLTGNLYQTVKIPKGLNVLYVNFNSGRFYTNSTIPISAQFEGGKTYILSFNANQSKTSMSFHIYLYDDKNKIKGEEVTILRNYQPAYVNYFIYVLSPARNKTVILENDDFLIEFKPDMVYTLTNKKTKRKTEGRAGFIMDPKTSMGTVYLYETNISVISREQFLSGPYQKEAQIVLLLLLNCSSNEVGFRYEKPSSQEGTEVKFSIK